MKKYFYFFIKKILSSINSLKSENLEIKKRGILFLRLLADKNETAIPLDDLIENNSFLIINKMMRDNDLEIQFSSLYVMGKSLSLGVIDISFYFCI